MDTLIDLFLKFMKIGAFSYGGGYTALSLIEREIVHNSNYLTTDEFLDVLALSQITPGPVGINASTYVGYKIMGFSGAIVATIAVVIVSFILVIIVAHYFLKFRDSKIIESILLGLKPAIIGMILTVTYKLGMKTISDYKDILIICLVVISVTKFKVHPIIAIFSSALIGLAIY
ncbi:MAG: chromate transporter [Bacillota bacterium]|nr:chromate transporter [Bacillota bacterium]